MPQSEVKEPTFHSVVELDLSELQRLSYTIDEDDSLERIYAQVLKAYRLGEFEALSALIKKIAPLRKKSDEFEILYQVSVLRLKIRQRTLSIVDLDPILTAGLQNDSWKAEANFVLAMACEVLEEHELSRKHYHAAWTEFEKQGSFRKSAKSLLNFVAAESRVHPEKKLIADYHFVFRKATEIGEGSVAGIALINISREFQKLGGTLIALKYCNQAIDILEKEFGSLQYDLAIAHRCHLLHELRRTQEFKLNYDYASTSVFPEVRAAVKILAEFAQGISESEIQGALPTWKERRSELETESLKLAPLEESLLLILSQGPKDRYEIIEGLYGPSIDFELSENRFKNLMNRVRKKLKNSIVFENGKYFLKDEYFLARSIGEAI